MRPRFMRLRRNKKSTESTAENLTDVAHTNEDADSPVDDHNTQTDGAAESAPEAEANTQNVEPTAPDETAAETHAHNVAISNSNAEEDDDREEDEDDTEDEDEEEEIDRYEELRNDGFEIADITAEDLKHEVFKALKLTWRSGEPVAELESAFYAPFYLRFLPHSFTGATWGYNPAPEKLDSTELHRFKSFQEFLDYLGWEG